MTPRARLWYNGNNAEIGRFICADSLDYLDPHTVGGLNLYAYCGNNPVMNVDPTGHGFWDAFLNFVAAVAIQAGTTATITKIASAAGTAIAPGLGTAIGAFVGFLAGVAYEAWVKPALDDLFE